MKSNRDEIKIYEKCEGCGHAVDQDKLIWDLKADRLVCMVCYLGKKVKVKKDN